MRCRMKQNNFFQSSSPIVLTCVSLLIFYSIYGLGPFTGMEEKIKDREDILAREEIMAKENVIKNTIVDWAKEGPEHYFWPNTSSCRIFRTRFAKVQSLPLRALVSYPGSGNTWIRYLIEGATGVYTGSIFSDSSLIRAGHLGEGREYNDGSTILQKTHHRSLYLGRYNAYDMKWREEHVREFGGRAVVVVRNPYKAILSYWNYFNTQSHTSIVSENSFESQKFQDFVLTGAERWLELVTDWVNLGQDVYFMFYEDLTEHPIREMRKLMEYLGYPVDESRLSCISHHLVGSFHRSTHQQVDPFTPIHHIEIRKCIKIATKMIKDKTGKDIPIEKYEYY